ncbi:DUF2069 domain-containing protein [Thiohalorhabdus sp.]|uniref:DUF2069 domain-containing protein n=1 Tax=Thiohalorhabdus sp. TaxID=3094134 RepID=UPI002FC3D415
MRKLLARPTALLSPPAWNGLAITGHLGVLANSLSWPLWYSPGGPYPEWMLLKVVPLILPLRGLLHGRRRTHQWASFLTLPYIMGSIAAIYGFLASPRFTSGLDLVGAMVQLVLAGVMLAGCMYYAYATAGKELEEAGDSQSG